MQTYKCPAPVWSCCWSSPSPNFLFAGCGNGLVLHFDIRVTSGPLESFKLSANSSPVTALQYLAPDVNSKVCQMGGMFIGQLTQLSFMAEESSPGLLSTPAENMPSTSSSYPVGTMPSYETYPLPLEGNLVSLSLSSPHRLLLASYRPSQRIPRVRHVFAELSGNRPENGQKGTFHCREMTSLFGGSQMRMMSRARIFDQERSQRKSASLTIYSKSLSPKYGIVLDIILSFKYFLGVYL